MHPTRHAPFGVLCLPVVSLYDAIAIVALSESWMVPAMESVLALRNSVIVVDNAKLVASPAGQSNMMTVVSTYPVAGHDHT